jgi:hypothetical protein
VTASLVGPSNECDAAATCASSPRPRDLISKGGICLTSGETRPETLTAVKMTVIRV